MGTTRLKGRKPVMTCHADAQPRYAATVILDRTETRVLGWVRPSRRGLGRVMVTACERGLVRIIGVMSGGDDVIERATATLVTYHRLRIAREMRAVSTER